MRARSTVACNPPHLLPAQVRSTFDKLFAVLEMWETSRLRPLFESWVAVSAR